MAALLALSVYSGDDEVDSSSNDEGELHALLLAYDSGPVASPTSALLVPDIEQPGATPNHRHDSKQCEARSKTPHREGAAGLEDGLPACIAGPPPGPCDPKLQEWWLDEVAKQRKQGGWLHADLDTNRAYHSPYRNPYHRQKQVDKYGIDQYGTCYGPERWAPKAFPEEDFYNFDEQEAQQRAQEGTPPGHSTSTKPNAAAATAALLHRNPPLPQLNQDAAASAAVVTQVKAQQMNTMASHGGRHA